MSATHWEVEPGGIYVPIAAHDIDSFNTTTIVRQLAHALIVHGHAWMPNGDHVVLMKTRKETTP